MRLSLIKMNLEQGESIELHWCELHFLDGFRALERMLKVKGLEDLYSVLLHFIAEETRGPFLVCVVL